VWRAQVRHTYIQIRSTAIARSRNFLGALNGARANRCIRQAEGSDALLIALRLAQIISPYLEREYGLAH
jgi:hypothetical protein